MQNSDNDAIVLVALITLVPFLMAFAFIIFLFYRQRRELTIRKEKSALQMRALRAQINPHFIFNCLNSIYNSIQSGKQQIASEYLLKFSLLVRRVLENSTKERITLQEDLEMLEVYLQLEQYRADNTFEYIIKSKIDLSAEEIDVPMLLIQPVVENAIWHGMGSSKEGKIEVDIHQTSDRLKYIVTNTKGSSNGETKNKHGFKSMGTSLIQDQLTAISTFEKKATSYVVVDNDPHHHKVEIEIPIKTYS